jgi:hypothetical protein
VNESKSAVARATERKFLSFTFWESSEREVKRCVAPQALARMKDRVRHLTRRVAGQSLAHVCERVYLVGWKGYFQLAQTRWELRNIDKWIRHRLRALQLKQWKRGTTTYRELVSRGMSAVSAATVARNAQRWWHDSAMKIHIALPNAYFDKLGLPRLAA